MHLLGQLLADQDDPDHYQTANDLLTRIGDTPAQAMTARQLGNAYQSIAELRDLDQAQHWHQRARDLTPEHDRIGRAATYGNLATVAHDRFLDALDADAPIQQLTGHLEQARADNQRSLDLLPDDHHQYRGNAHTRLGAIFSEVGDVPTAIGHYCTPSATSRSAGIPTGGNRLSDQATRYRGHRDGSRGVSEH